MKRSGDAEDIEKNCELQISLNNLYQYDADRLATTHIPTAVSTGLRLSCEDGGHSSSFTSASGSMTSLPLITSLCDNLSVEINHHKDEIDHYIRIQEEQLIRGVKEKTKRHMVTLLNAIKTEASKKLKEKELELESINQKNRQLVEQNRQMAEDAHAWKCQAWYSETVVSMLRSQLKEAMAQPKEGCGDNQAEDVASSCGPILRVGGLFQASLLGSTSRDDERWICRSCRIKETSMLLMPCRHLCLCDDCEKFVDVCPVCLSMKYASFQVNMASKF